MKRNIPYGAVVDSILRGGVGVVPTDTIYGIIGSALNEAAVKKIYRLRKRNLKKPMIVLISSLDDLKLFGITTTPAIKNALRRVWPGKVSVILNVKPAAFKKFRYLHRGTGAIAFRLPKPAALRSFIEKTGPLVAPSANIEGEPPARNLKEAKGYFGDRVAFYIDAGRLVSKPSTLIAIVDGKIVVLRKGAVKIR